jgi:glucokinase
MMRPLDVYIGLDVGGTYLKGARIDVRGEILARLHEPIRKDSSDALRDQLQDAVRRLEGDGPSAGVGLGVPGIVDLRGGRVRNAPNLSEAWLGAGRGADTILFVTLGTGVGGSLVFHGRVWAGRSGYAGEIGHIQVDPAGRPCGCGSRGCVETIAGIGGWVRLAQEALDAGRPSSLREASAIDPEVIVNAARMGDPVAVDVVEGAAGALGIGISAALNLLNVERVVVGGGVARAGDFLLERIVAATERRTFAHVFQDASFRLAELSADAGVIGAARVGMIGAQAAYA